MAHQELSFYLLHGVERDAYDDQQRGATNEAEGVDPGDIANVVLHQGDHAQEDGTGQSDAPPFFCRFSAICSGLNVTAV